MATVKFHPGISRYHRHFDTRSSSEQERKAMLTAYESGHLVLLENCDLELDFDLFDRIRIEVHPDRHLQYLISKLSTRDYLDILWGSEAPFARLVLPKKRKPNPNPERERAYAAVKSYLRSTAFSSLELRVRLASQILEFERHILRFYESIFPEYGFDRYSINWRMTECRAESVHVDSYDDGRGEEFHQLKLFVNLDSAPRIWNTGELMKTLVSRHYRDLDLDKRLDLDDLDRFLDGCNKILLNAKSGPKDCHFFHTTFFERGDVWIADTRHIPHQIFFGRKMVSVLFYIDPKKRIAPELSMKHFVDQLRRGAVPQEPMVA